MSQAPPSSPREQSLPQVFAGVFGALLGLSLLKFVNPPIMEHWIAEPGDLMEFLIAGWPIAWAYALLGLLIFLGLFVARWKLDARWLLALPLVWLGCQLLAATHTLDAELTRPTLKHFTACVVCFYLGYFCLSRVQRLTFFWAAVAFAFLIVLAVGWQQHFGGLEETRKYFYQMQAAYPGRFKDTPPEYLKKMASTRIFSTLFYPNTLAGALLLVLPPLLAWIGQAREQLTLAARGFLAACTAIGAAGCLYWSGSKGGWLLMMLLGLLALLRLPLSKRIKLGILGLVLVAGLAGFAYKYAAFFRKGATSVSARFDYWRAAAQTAAANPVFGTGPGTFFIPYAKIKRPESEMTRLVHNDYLEQASDCGLAGFFAYTIFILGALIRGMPRWPISDATEPRGDWLPFAVWLGVLGWALQGLFEFGLYIPALAWPAFAFLGLLLGWRQQPTIGPEIRNRSQPESGRVARHAVPGRLPTK
jgi:O-antigen ligase